MLACRVGRCVAAGGGGGGAAGCPAARARAPPAGARSAPDPSSRANPCPEVTDLFCRIPLATLLYRPEAVHLGDLMRFGYALLCGQSPGV
jgi:hypothetical protein